jgi:MFS family permease
MNSSTQKVQSSTSRGLLGSLDKTGKRAFWASAGGWALDSYDYQVFPFSLLAIAATFSLTTAESGWIDTITLLVSAIGGVFAGMLADRIGRVKTLMITVSVFAVFTMLSGFAPNYESLLTFRGLQGLGFGGEWAVGAALMAEYADTENRGKLLGAVQSAWSIGWAVALVAYTLIFSFANDEWAWRFMFFTGALPALFLLYIRRQIPEPEIFTDAKKLRLSTKATAKGFSILFSRAVVKRTIFACLLATGVQGGYYAVMTWLPFFLRTERKLSVVGTGGYLATLIIGSFLGYIFAGYLADWLGRKPTFAIFSVASGLLVVAYTSIPTGNNILMLVLGLPLGFCASGIFSGFGSFLAELFPSTVRATGQGFCYNFGRAVGALFPLGVGYLAINFGTAGAIMFGAFGYLLALIALAFLPETRGTDLRVVDETAEVTLAQ